MPEGIGLPVMPSGQTRVDFSIPSSVRYTPDAIDAPAEPEQITNATR
jgi:hypothetical protein